MKTFKIEKKELLKRSGNLKNKTIVLKSIRKINPKMEKISFCDDFTKDEINLIKTWWEKYTKIAKKLERVLK